MLQTSAHNKIIKPETRASFAYLFKSLTFVGWMSSKRYKYFCLVHSILVILISMIILPLGFNLSLLNINKMTAGQLLTTLQGAANASALPFKFVIFAYNLPRLKNAAAILSMLDARCQTSEEFSKLRAMVNICNRYYIYMAVVYTVFFMSTIIGAISIHQAPYSLYIPFLDWHNSQLEFCLQCLCETVCIFYAVFYQLVIDCFVTICIYILRRHLRILITRVEALGSDSEVVNKKPKTANMYIAELISCIWDHKNILTLFNFISPLVSMIIFVQLLTTALVLGTTLINILVFADPATKIGSVSYFIAVWLQTLPCCYQITLLENDCAQLPVALFHSNCYGLDKHYKRMLIFFMQHTQEAMTLTAMKMYPININTFINMAKFSFSIYTLIENMDLNKA